MKRERKRRERKRRERKRERDYKELGLCLRRKTRKRTVRGGMKQEEDEVG